MPVAGGPKLTTTGILLEVDAADRTSYSGTGTTWTNQVRPGTFNGTLNNISFNSTDAKGALVFTGSNTFVDFGNLGPSLTSSFSFQVAFKPATTASGQPYTILSYASASATSSITFKLDYTSSNQTAVLSIFSTGSGAARTVHIISGSANSGSWNIVHGTFGAQSAAFYINGLFINGIKTTGSAVGYNTSNRLYVGLNYGSTSGYFTGSVANITVNNAELNVLQVGANYKALATRFGLPVIGNSISDIDVYRFVQTTGLSDDLQVAAINTLVTSLKANNLWTKMRVIYPFIGGTATLHKYNLVNPDTFQIQFFGPWTHDSNGATSTVRSTAYANTGFIPSSNTLSSTTGMHMFYYMKNATGASYTTLLSANNSNINNAYSGVFGRVFGGTAVYRASEPATSYMLLSKQVAGTNNLFGQMNGVLTNVYTDSTFNIDSTQFVINPDIVATAALVAFGEGLSQAEGTTLYNIISAYQTTLGR
jgi:hypothetical protein